MANTFPDNAQNHLSTKKLNILFLTLYDFKSINERNIYSDLLREFIKLGHEVFVISPTERRNGERTHFIEEENCRILKIKIGNTQKTNFIEKGISTVLMEPQYRSAIKKYFCEIIFDLVIYSTPPITLTGAIEYVKKRDNARSYLMLKDIFPQNAVDIGMMKTTGLRGLLFKHFRKQERKLYAISDRIGCMSQANADYVIKHNPDIDPSKVEICPNSIDVVDKSVNENSRIAIRSKYDLPLDKKIFIYGGNLGKPQGIPFLVECLRKSQIIENAFFLIVGDGTEFHLISEYLDREKPANVKLLSRLPKEDYETMVGACDVGMIFLDHRFSIPNFPSRLLAYMQAKIPVLAVTDRNTDIGKVIVEGKFGWWIESNDSDGFVQLVGGIVNDLKVDPEEEFRYLIDNFSSKRAAETIIGSLY